MRGDLLKWGVDDLAVEQIDAALRMTGVPWVMRDDAEGRAVGMLPR